MVENMKVSGKTIRCMDRVNTFGLTDKHILATMIMIRRMAMGFLFGKKKHS